MFKKMIVGVLVFGISSLFAMSLSALNGASKTELMEINGIGEVKAAAIIKERRHGKFKSFDDLTRVEGIGEQTAANVKNGTKSAASVKKVKKSTKKKITSKKSKTSKNDLKKKAKKKTKSKKEKAEKKTKKRKIKSMDEKKKELKSKAKKTKTKKTKAKKKKKTKSKKKN